MDITVDGLFYLFLALIGTVSFLLGLLVLKKSKAAASGFGTAFIVSFLLLIVLFWWFQAAAAGVFMGTIPWLFNQAAAIVLYAIYIAVTRLVFKKVNRESVKSI